MATIYNFQVKAVSAFCAYPEEQIKQIIEKALSDFQDENTGLKLESIEVKNIKKR